ncbi:MAG: hypothetical protein Q8P80_03395 [Candidatus Levybacteria bacterium]|nr:hypothetical protein [Candidatus Levybacteria bacterium]
MKFGKYYLLIIFISLLPLYSIFTTSKLLHTHDGLVHLPRIAAYFKALMDLQIPVRWAGDLNYGYGMPLFNFMYQIPYLFSSVFIFLGFSLVNSFKIVLSLSYILSGIFMFAFASRFFKDARKGFLVTVFYQFAPFRLIEVLTRGSFGEVYTYAFFPLVLFGLVSLSRKINYFNFLLTAFAVGFLILSHNSLSLVFFTICAGFIFVVAKERKNYIFNFASLLTGLLLASFYWIPAIFEHKYTYGDLFMKNMYLSHFPPLLNFFIPNFTNDLRFQTGGISVQFGIFHVIGIILSIIFFMKKRDLSSKKIIIFSLFVTSVAIFFMQSVSKIFWENISMLRQFQFPWRFLAVMVFTTSIFSVSFLNLSIFRKNIYYAILIIVVILSTVHYWNPPLGFDKIDEKYYWNFPLTTTYYGETDVIWSEGPAKLYPKNRVDVIGGRAQISNFTKKSNLQTFKVSAQTNAQLVDHTQYFPGWKVYSNGKQVPIEFQDQNWRGQITFYLPKGENLVRVEFGENPIRIVADVLSLITAGGILGFGIIKKLA